jgi:twitching motility protein PilT
MVDTVNSERAVHVLTIEDPIEVLHADKMASVNQRELGTDTADWATALRAAMRQDPDVILIGEMRDAETVKAALSAAETGHFVMSTLHTTDAKETVNRIIDFFLPHEQKQVRLGTGGLVEGHHLSTAGTPRRRLSGGCARWRSP